MVIDLLRHGETSAGNVFIGSSDVLLNERGQQQMQVAAQALHGYSQVISSPLQRCRQFATAYSQQKNIILQVEADLKEYHFGDWEKKSSDDLWHQQGKALLNFWENPENYAPPNAEKLIDFHLRIKNVMTRIIEQSEGPKLLVIAHGGVIRSIIAGFLDMPLNAMMRLQISHASLSRIEIHIDNGKIYASINFINKTSL